MIKNRAIFIIISGILWGTTGIYSHIYSSYGIPPVTMSILRVFCAMIVITPFMIKKGRKSFVLSKRGFIIACIQGVITQAVFNVAYFTAIGKFSCPNLHISDNRGNHIVLLLQRNAYHEKSLRYVCNYHRCYIYGYRRGF